MSACVLSVIVPAFQCAPSLERCLTALAASDLPRHKWEIIVVDDASTDQTAAVAARHADHVVRLVGPPSGPAAARNRGAEVARAEVLLFVDADVCVHPATLGQFDELFRADPALGAAFGSYDAAPPGAGLVSQYRNLLHHYVHHQSPGDAETFWAGCGAVRHSVFLAAGLFDERRYVRPQIEDIELGYRIRDLGHRIVLRPEIQGTHLKRWTLRGMLVTDLRDRGVPWMRLLLERRTATRAGPLNLGRREQLLTATAGGVGLAVVAAVLTGSAWWLLGAAAGVALVIAGNARLYTWFARQRGWWFALRLIPLRLLYYMVNGVAAVVGWYGSVVAGMAPARPLADADRRRRPVRQAARPTESI